MANPPKDGFPVFRDGDVEISLSRKPEDRFVLHSVVLGLHSPFFKISISERWSGRNDDAASGDPIKWRYQLLFEEEVNDDEVPLLAKAVCRFNDQSQTLRLKSQTRNQKYLWCQRPQVCHQRQHPFISRTLLTCLRTRARLNLALL